MKNKLLSILFQLEFITKLSAVKSKNLMTILITRVNNFIQSFYDDLKMKILISKNYLLINFRKTKLLAEIKIINSRNKLKSKIEEIKSKYRGKVTSYKEKKNLSNVIKNNDKIINVIGNHANVYNSLQDILEIAFKQMDYELEMLIRNDIFIIRPDSEEFVNFTLKFIERIKMNTGKNVYKLYCDWYGGEKELLEFITFWLYRKIAATMKTAVENLTMKE